MKKFLSLVLSVIMVLSLVACAGNKQASSTTTAAANETAPETAAPSTLPEKLIMVTNAEFPPYEFKDGGNFKGIDVEIAKKIGEKLGCEVEILDIAFDSIIPTVMSGKGDFAMAGMTVTEDRQKNVDFSKTYQTAVQAIVVPTNSAIKNDGDLQGKKIGVQAGTTGDLYCTDDFGDANISRYTKIVDGMQALKSGKIDAIVVDDQVAKEMVKEAGDGYKILATPYTSEEYAIAVKKGNTELLNKINNALNELIQSGEVQKIVAEYIKE